jgi:hypothetical protein
MSSKFVYFSTTDDGSAQFGADGAVIPLHVCRVRIVHTDSHPVLEMDCNGGKVILMKSDQWSQPDF